MKSGSSLLPLLQPVNIHMLTIYEKKLSISSVISISPEYAGPLCVLVYSVLTYDP